MGTILSFARDSGQWTASERGRLEIMMEQVLGGGQDLHIAFGATDDGAPWCAVTNADGEVLVHVARMAGSFMAHFVAEDVVTQGVTLQEAFGKRVAAEPERMGVVLPFPRAAGGLDMLTMLAVATLLEERLKLAEAFLQDSGVPISAPTSGHALAPSDDPTATGADESGARTASTPDHADEGGRAATSQADSASPQEEGSTDEQAPAQVAKLEPAAEGEAPRAGIEIQAGSASRSFSVVIQGGEADDVLIGTARAERLVGGPGDDVLIGGGGRDTLEGGAGDDWIVLTGEAIAYGGSGGDTFVITAPKVMGDADTLLGTIADFREDEGDRLMTTQGDLLSVAPRAEGTAPLSVDGDRRVDVDLDGDGAVDGYVVLTHAQGDVATVASTGWSGWSDLFG